MRPPVCEVCRRKAHATVSFADYRPLPDGMTGHPRGLGWFCRLHLPGARALARSSMGPAVRRLRLLTVVLLAVGGAVVLFALGIGIYWM